jgi:hypothetical protein
LARNQVQAAGLIGTFGAVGALGAKVALVNQPDLNTGYAGPFHRAVDHLLQQMLHRMLVGDFQKHSHRAVWIEPAITLTR